MMNNNLLGKKIIIVSGHYGSGKTNIAVNLALDLRREADKSDKGIKVALVDLDVVNPFFRSADSRDELERLGVKCIAPPFANTNSDMPAIPPEIYSLFSGSEDMRAVIDVGGDAAGAVVLGMFADKIKGYDHEMIYVVNKYRPQIAEVDAAAGMALFIEEKSRLKITSVINNSNIGEFTTERDISATFDYARQISEKLNVPCLAHTAFIDTESGEIEKINNYTKKIF